MHIGDEFFNILLSPYNPKPAIGTGLPKKAVYVPIYPNPGRDFSSGAKEEEFPINITFESYDPTPESYFSSTPETNWRGPKCLDVIESVTKIVLGILNPIGSACSFPSSKLWSSSKFFQVGHKELKGGAIFFVNGIMNSYEDAKKSAEALSSLGDGIKVHVLHNASHGLWIDLQESFYHLHYISTRPVEMLRNQILNYFEKHGIEKRMFLTCHSQGALITRNALTQLPREIRNRISVLSVSPAGYIDRHLCRDIEHYISDRDPAPLYIDRTGFKRCIETVTVLKCGSLSLMDHSYGSSTFTEIKKGAIQRFIKENSHNENILV